MTDVDLLGVARRVAGDARAGEQVEAYVLRSRDIDVKVFGGEVESLSVAEVEGVGVRVIVDGRQGYAWAGSLDADVVAETVAEARDNAAFGAPDESLRARPLRATPTASTPPRSTSGATTCSARPTADKVALALELEAATRAADPRVRGVESASYGDAAVEAAVANSLGARGGDAAHGLLVLGVRDGGRGHRDPDRQRLLGGPELRRARPARRGRDAAERAVRLLGAKQIPSANAPGGVRPAGHPLAARARRRRAVG